MNTSRFLSISVISVVTLACAAILISGCGGPRTPAALAEAALTPANSPEEEKEQEKAVLELGNMKPDDPGVREALREVLTKSDKVNIRNQAMLALGSMKDFQSGKLFIKSLSADDRGERARAYDSICKVLRINLFADGLDENDKEIRDAQIKKIDDYYEFFKSKPEFLEKMGAKK
jgi:hypothetical protein